MSRPIRIADMETKVRWQADMERAVLRNTSKDVRRAINQSLQAFRDVFSGNGDSYFLASYTGTMDAGQGSVGDVPLPWGIIDISGINPDVVRIVGIDVRVAGNLNIELGHISFAERNYNQSQWMQQGVPQSFFSYNENTIAVIPPPQQSYEYILWYLPLLPELLGDDDEINPGIPGADEWIVADVCVKLLARNNNLKLTSAFMNMRETAWQRISMHASKRQNVSPTYRLDTRGRRLRKRWLSYWGWQ